MPNVLSPPTIIFCYTYSEENPVCHYTKRLRRVNYVVHNPKGSERAPCIEQFLLGPIDDIDGDHTAYRCNQLYRGASKWPPN